jgi:transcriptional regulator with XRE-family HTH domain
MNMVNGTRLKEARRARGYTQQKLAELANTSQTHLSQVESGIAPVSMKMLAKLAILVNVDLRELVLSTSPETSRELAISLGLKAGEEIKDAREALSPEKLAAVVSDEEREVILREVSEAIGSLQKIVGVLAPEESQRMTVCT